MPETAPLLNRFNKFWVAMLVLAFFGLWAFSAVLLPFVVAIIAAYVLDPVCDWLERKGMSRTLATSLVTFVFVLFFAVFFMLAIPPLIAQFLFLVQSAPEIFQTARTSLAARLTSLTSYLPINSLFGSTNPNISSLDELWQQMRQFIGEDALKQLSLSLAQSAGSIFNIVLALAGTLWSGSLAVINAVSLIFITPFVTFYLLRDWDKKIASIDSLVPAGKRAEVRTLASQVDTTLAGFMRGQSIVVMMMSVYYCAGLGLVGLNFWLLVGLVAGLFSFVPFVGAIIGFVLSVGLALYQFDSLTPVLITIVVFMVGQFIEGNILTPKFVGGRVGLHPVWVMFALMAGASLFGFLGILVAVPVASIIGVFIRFGIAKYRESLFFGQEDEIAFMDSEDMILPEEILQEENPDDQEQLA